MASIKQLSVGLIKRNAIKRGPTSSDAWNDSFEEVVNDLNNITSAWNNTLFPLLSGLPDGVNNDLDAFTNGLDGRTMYVDSSSTDDVTNTTYYNTLEDRPRSVKEQFDNVYDRLTTIKEELETEIVNASGGLTSDQKARIGANIFDNSATSSSTSIDGKAELNRLNVTQLGLDLYGDDFALNNDGTANLLYSIKQQLGALLTLHNGTWNADISVDHSGVGGTGDFLANGSVPMTGSFKAASGSAASPGITFASDTGNNTGFYLVGEDQLGISIGGSLRLTINATNELVPADGSLNVSGSIVSSSLISSSTVLRQTSGYFGNTLDGAGAIAHIFDTLNAYSVGDALLVVRNNGADRLTIGNTGDVTATGSVECGADFVLADGSQLTTPGGLTAVSLEDAVGIKFYTDGNEVADFDTGGTLTLNGQLLVDSIESVGSTLTAGAPVDGSATANLLLTTATLPRVAINTTDSSGFPGMIYLNGKMVTAYSTHTIPDGAGAGEYTIDIAASGLFSDLILTNNDADGANVALNAAGVNFNGAWLTIVAGDNSQPFTVKQSSTTFLASGVDFTMNEHYTLMLRALGPDTGGAAFAWVEVARSRN